MEKQTKYVPNEARLQKKSPSELLTVIDEGDGITILSCGRPFMSLSGVSMEYTSEGLRLYYKDGNQIGFMESGEGGCWKAIITGISFEPIN